MIIKEILGIVSILLIIFAITPYAIAIFKKEGVRPRPLTWAGWTLLLTATLYAQVKSKGWDWSQSALVVTIVCCGFIALITMHNGNIKIIDIACIGLGVVCFGVYHVTKDVWATTLTSVIADFFIGFPTIKNAYDDPYSEKSVGWTIGSVGYFISIINCIESEAIYWVFPVYLFSYNMIIVFLTNRNIS